MVECKLSLLETSFSPGLIKLHIELMPGDGELFDLPMEEAGKKLSAVANYAASTFGVRAAEPHRQGADDPSQKKGSNNVLVEHKLWPVRKKRIIDLHTRELERMKKVGSPIEVAKAETSLTKAHAYVERIDRQIKEQQGKD